MKKIFTALMALASVAITLISCSDNEAYFTANENDAPRILNTDIPETSAGARAALPSISRDNNFKFDVIVTPAEYTTVTWFVDGEKVFEGKSIDYPIIAGIHDVDIVATTTKGKSTKRLCTLEVIALDTDPNLASDKKSRWYNPGATVTVSGTNLDGVIELLLGGMKVENFSNNGNSISFTVPELAEGDYNMILVTKDMKYGCGKGKVTQEKYVDPGVQIVTLWTGDVNINWGDSNVQLHDELANVPAGAKIVFHYEMIAADYHCIRVTNNDWTKDILPQVDNINDTNPESFEIEYTADAKAIADESCMLITGFGYKLTSVTAEIGAPAETVVWEGETTINWGDSNVSITPELLEGAVGKTISLYYDVPEAEYHAMRICGPWWDGDLVAQFDITGETPNPYEFEYTDGMKAIVDEQGGMLIVGFGYTLTKVTIK